MLSLQAMSDRFELQDLVTRYCHAIDARAWAELDTIFTPHAVIDYTATGGIVGGLAEVKAFLAEMLPLFTATQHLVSNLQVIIEGDTATGRSILFNPVTLEREGAPHTFFVGAWYIDAYVRTDAGWRIAERRQERAYFHNQ